MRPVPFASPQDDTPILDFDEHGQPFSPRYRDIYRSRTGATDEAREVFLRGCNLPGGWAGRARFTILELGFGLGVNFLATLRAWRDDPARPETLEYVSIELHPLSRAQLAAGLAALKIEGPHAALLARSLPAALPGLHRLVFESGRVALTLAYGDARSLAANLAIAVDAFFLDGFAPSRNPAMWEPQLMRSLARIARPGAALATYSAAGAVRRALIDAGFEARIESGHATKRHQIRANYAPRWRTFPFPAAPPCWESRTALVVGGGIAGCACARALALRGWQVRLVERRVRTVSEGSAQPALADHIHLSPDDNHLARLTRAALLLSRNEGDPRAWRRVEPMARGALQLSGMPAEFDKWREMLPRLAFARDFASALDAAAASEVAGLPLASGCLWLPGCAAFDPLHLGEQWIADSGANLLVANGVEVGAIRRVGQSWRAIDTLGRTLDESSIVILANAGDATRLASLSSAPIRRVRGQSTLLTGTPFAALRAMLSGDAYACPLGAGQTLVGSTFDDGATLAADPEADLSNLRRLSRISGAPLADLIGAARSGSTGYRYAARDHLPLIGTLPDESAVADCADELVRNSRLALPVAEGLYGAFAFGSRGLLWSVLAAEVLAALVDGGVPPIEADLLAAVDPARFLGRSLRRRARGRAARAVG